MSEHPGGVRAGSPGPRHGRWPTPWPAVNELVGRLRDGVAAVLGERLVGLYLSGSLVGRLRDGVAAVLGERLVGLYLSGSLAAGDYSPSDRPIRMRMTSLVPSPISRTLASR